MINLAAGSGISWIRLPASPSTMRENMWSGRHDSYFEATGRAIDEQLQRSRSRERAKAVKYSREQVAQSRKISHASEVAELERLAVLGQIPQAEYKARSAALDEEFDERDGHHDRPGGS
ncbi:hypothetical protein [Streptomyces sirii]|uniref:hypothetical protein n=1 Tax=Streptomyces sirii TaxID=3127701 RepID=UPI003D3688FD